jgi:uncharacterized protein (TIGR03118 family)
MNKVSRDLVERAGDGDWSRGRRHLTRRWLAAIALATATVGAAAIPVGAAGTGRSPSSSRHDEAENEFHQTNLVSDLSTVGAQVVDPNLKNPWGLAASPTSPLWVADNNGDVATVYSGDVKGTPITGPNLTVAIPGGVPTGQVFNPTQRFTVTSATGSGPAVFIFSSESGRITAWSPAAGAGSAVLEFSSPTAIYKGLAIAKGRHGTLLYATNFHDGTVDVFNSSFHYLSHFGGFHDSHLPKGYAPFGIQEIKGRLYVTYALQDANKEDDVKGPGHGFIDVFTPGGHLERRLASRGRLDSPWGITLAPKGFGPFAGKLLVGNFGDGRINVFSRHSGHSEGPLRNEPGKPITIEGLWGLLFGNSATGGPRTLLFSAGINDEADGLLGALNAAD